MLGILPLTCKREGLVWVGGKQGLGKQQQIW